MIHEMIDLVADKMGALIAGNIREYVFTQQFEITRLECKLALAIEQDYCTICGRILGEAKDDKDMGST